MAATAGLAAAPAVHASPSATGPLRWAPCHEPANPGAECATLSVPVDWAHPDGPTLELAVARRKATDPGARVGSMVFGPGGPGDSGVRMVVDRVGRFSPEVRRRFDIVSFDPRGLGDSNPVTCSGDLLAQRPSPVIRNSLAVFTPASLTVLRKTVPTAVGVSGTRSILSTLGLNCGSLHPSAR